MYEICFSYAQNGGEKTDFLPCIYQSLMSFFSISVDSETYGDLYQVYIPTAW